MSSQWVAGLTAGGLPGHTTFKYNPRFQLTAQAWRQTFLLSLSTHPSQSPTPPIAALGV